MSEHIQPTISDLGCLTTLLLLSPLIPNSAICVAVNYGQQLLHPDEIPSSGPVFNSTDTIGQLACDAGRYIALINTISSPDGIALTPVLAIYAVSIVQTLYSLHKSSQHARKNLGNNRQ